MHRRLYCLSVRQVKALHFFRKIVCDDRGTDMDFPIVDMVGKAAAIICDENDFKGVRRAATDLAEDISRVCGVKPRQADRVSVSPSIIVGTLGKSRLIDDLVEKGSLDVSDLRGKWESFCITTLE